MEQDFHRKYNKRQIQFYRDSDVKYPEKSNK